jgi:hypothetical protein
MRRSGKDWGVVSLFALLISFVASTPFAKAHQQKPLNMHQKNKLFFSSFNLFFPLEAFLHFPSSTYVHLQLARFSMKASSICSPSMEFPGKGCCFLNSQNTNHIKEDDK